MQNNRKLNFWTKSDLMEQCVSTPLNISFPNSWRAAKATIIPNGFGGRRAGKMISEKSPPILQNHLTFLRASCGLLGLKLQFHPGQVQRGDILKAFCLFDNDNKKR